MGRGDAKKSTTCALEWGNGDTMQGKLSSTCAIVRSFNNKYVEKQVRSLSAMGIGKIIVVTDAARDKGATRHFLGAHLENGRVQLIEMQEGYSWANALNIALMAVRMANIRDRKLRFRFVFTVSVEAKFTAEHVERMLDAATDDESVGVVGTTFEGRQDGNVVSLGRSYRHPRNTGMLIRIEAFGFLFGGFDARCDRIGGMEDIDFVLDMIAVADLRYVMLDLGVPLVLGNHYHQPSKEIREREAVDSIIAHWRSLFPNGTPERDRIEIAIDCMGIDR